MSRTLDALSLSRDEEAIIEDKVKECAQQWKFRERYLPGHHGEAIIEEKVKERYLPELHALSYLPIG
jgi:hypothetical protein